MKLKYKILVHLFFWVYFINQSLFPYYIGKTEPGYYKDVIIYMLTCLITFYPVYFSLPFFFSRNNIFFRILVGISLLGSLILIRFGIEYSYWKYIFPPHTSGYMSMDDAMYYNSIRLVIINAIYAILIRLAINWYDAQKLKSELIQQNQASELALLRSQVNPHFLFNTLNNIYSLVYKKSEDAPAAVMKLSSIMRYMLYDANTDKVLLEKEIEYLQSFIELQKLRLRNQDCIDLKIAGSSNGWTIAPMLLIPFVENAFKHGSKITAEKAIRINLNIEPGKLTFEVINPVKRNTMAAKDVTGGIGLQNLGRRLQLLYPGKHHLEIKDDEEIFQVKLIIEN